MDEGLFCENERIAITTHGFILYLSLCVFQEYLLPEVKDRQYLITMHKSARKVGLDLSRYNQLKEQVYDLERDLRRLRDPLQVSSIKFP